MGLNGAYAEIKRVRRGRTVPLLFGTKFAALCISMARHSWRSDQGRLRSQLAASMGEEAKQGRVSGRDTKASENFLLIRRPSQLFSAKPLFLFSLGLGVRPKSISPGMPRSISLLCMPCQVCGIDFKPEMLKLTVFSSASIYAFLVCRLLVLNLSL